MTNQKEKPLIINNWQTAIADSPAMGFGMIKNAVVDVQAGTVGPAFAPTVKSPVSSTSVFTWSHGANLGTITGTFAALTTGTAVTLTTTGALPTGLATNTTYFIIKFSATQFSLASTLGNALSNTPIAVTTDDGSGTNTMITVDPGQFNSIVDGYILGSGDLFTFMADSNGRVWFVDNNGFFGLLLQSVTVANGSGHGIALFTNSDASKTYLFVYKNAKIDVCDVSTQAFRQDPIGNSAWTATWQALKSNQLGNLSSHQAFLGTNNIIYGCDNNWINSIQEVNGQVFDPGNVATYTYQNAALTLLSGTKAQCLEQLGSNLMIGDLNTARIYPWDRSSSNPGLPVLVPEVGIYGMKNIGNWLYILGGTRGNVYKTYGFLVTLAKKVPEYITTSNSTTQITWGGISSKNGNLLFGLGAPTAANSGVYMMTPDGRLTIEATALAGSQTPTVINSPKNEFFMFGYNGGFEAISSSRWANFGAVVQSELYEVGNKTDKAKFSQLELQLEQAGAAGAHIRIKYRTDTRASFVDFSPAISYTTDGTATSFNTDIGLENLENIQIQMEMDGTAVGPDMLLVREVRLFQ